MDKVWRQTYLELWTPTTNREMTFILVIYNAHNSLNPSSQISHARKYKSCKKVLENIEAACLYMWLSFVRFRMFKEHANWS